MSDGKLNTELGRAAEAQASFEQRYLSRGV
jgi:hypothetical protein